MASFATSSTTSKIVDHATFVRSSTKLHALWLKKVGVRVCTAPRIFSSEPSSPSMHVAFLMNNYLNHVHSSNKHLVQGFKNLWDAYKKTQIIHLEFPYEQKYQFWVYDTRKTDFLPRTQRDMEKVIAFVDFLLTYDKYFYHSATAEAEIRDYLRKHITLTASYLIFYLTSPGFFHLLNETRYTKKGGKQRTWFPILLEKYPKKVEKKEKLAHNQFKSECTDLVTTLPRLRAKYDEVCERIHNLFDMHFEKKHYLATYTQVDMDDVYSVNSALSVYVNPSSSSVNSFSQAKAKKLQKLIQELQKIAPKIRLLEKKMQIDDLTHDSVFGANVKKIRREAGPTTTTHKPQKDEDKKDGDESGAAAEEDDENSIPDNWEDALF